jgi:hypothetical protein
LRIPRVDGGVALREMRTRRQERGTRNAERTDWRWLGMMAAAIVLLCGLPYALAALFGPAELQRLGTFWFARDFSQYEAAMREGARQSGWLIHDHFSVEPHRPALMYVLYVGAGKLAALLGLSDVSLFVALEWIGRFAVLGATYLFAATFLIDRRQRRLAVVLSLGTLGLDAWVAPLHILLEGLGAGAIAGFLPESINPYLEVSSFGVLLSAPHLMLGLALTLASAPIYLRATDGRRAWLALLGATVALLSLVHSFNTPVLASVLAAHALLFGRKAWPAALVTALAAAPMVIYSLLLYQADPFWSGTYSAQNIMPSPAPWSLPFDFGLVLLAAPLASKAVLRWPNERRWLIALWVCLGLAWMYAPVAYQRRFAFGVQPGLAVLAAVGVLELNARLRSARALRRRFVNYAVALAAVSTSLLVYVSLLASAILNKPAPVYLWSLPEAAAAAWLGQHSTAEDVVLASTEFANPLVGAIDGRVVHGHIVATLRSPEKEALVHRFFAADVTPEERHQLLRNSMATVVALGPQERALGVDDLSGLTGLELAYDRDGVQLYRVSG